MKRNFLIGFLVIGLTVLTACGGAAVTGGDGGSNGNGGNNNGGGATGGNTGGNNAGGNGGTVGEGGSTAIPEIPNALVMTVRESEGVARPAEIVRSGVPLARELNVLNTSSLAVVNSNNVAIPAEFRILARWNAGLTDATAPIQWVLVGFPVTINANAAQEFRLVTDGSIANPPYPSPLTLAQNGNQITVNTGTATFVLGGSNGALFDSVTLANNTQLVNGGAMTAQTLINGSTTNATHTVTRRVTIEHQSALSAVVVVEGAYNHAAVGGGALGTIRRYTFTAGSPVAIVRHVVKWEGSFCDRSVLECNNAPNGVRLTGVADTLGAQLTGTRTVSLIADQEAAAVSGTVGANQTASVRQLLRAERTAAMRFERAIPGNTAAANGQADGGVLSLSGSNGALAIAINHLHRYEPQALRVLSNGNLSVDIVDTTGGQAWLGNRQGLYSTFAIGAFDSAPSRNQLDQGVWAPLNHPLRAWPDAQWFASSQAVEEFPVGPLPQSLAAYDTLVPRILNQTIDKINELGLSGLMTYGLYPREWGRNNADGEVDCGANPTTNQDPTDNETWDNTYWCSTWTDYHNSSMVAGIWAMRTGQTRWLDEVSAPAAHRMLHTQIFQCSPTDTNDYCGQAFNGYQGYRADNNTSHGYFENLFLYYWLTGDSTVVDTVRRGAESRRRYVCPARGNFQAVTYSTNGPSGPACSATAARLDFWAKFTDRVGAQGTRAIRFTGMASSDATFLDDYKSDMARGITQNYVQSTINGKPYGFYTDASMSYSGNSLQQYVGQTIVNPLSTNTGSSDQLWMSAIYDFYDLYLLQRDTNDAPTGSPAIRPSEVILGYANFLTDYASTVHAQGNGLASGTWPNGVTFRFTGSHIGGDLTNVAADPGGSDPILYAGGKAPLASVVLRGYETDPDEALLEMGQGLVEEGLAGLNGAGEPLGKITGIFMARLHAGVARLAALLPEETNGSNPGADPEDEDDPGQGNTGGNGTIGPVNGALFQANLNTNEDSVTPSIGLGGTSNLIAGDFVAAQTGNGASFSTGKYLRFPAGNNTGQNIELDRGTIEFWYRPNYSSSAADDTPHVLFTVGDSSGAPRLTLTESDTVAFTLVSSDWNIRTAAGGWRAANWSAGQAVAIRVTWDTALQSNAIKLFINGNLIAQSGAGGWNMGTEATIGSLIIGAGNTAGDATANGIIDNFVIRNTAQ